MSILSKSIGTDSRLVVVSSVEEREPFGPTDNRFWVYFGDKRNVLESDNGADCQHSEYIKSH